MKCDTCQHATNKDILADPDKIDAVPNGDVESRLPRCMCAISPRHQLIVFGWMSCDNHQRSLETLEIKTVYCPICLGMCIPDQFSGECNCDGCGEIFESEDGLTAEEVQNVGCPGSTGDI